MLPLAVLGCSSDDDPDTISAADRQSWQDWSYDFVSAVCDRDLTCGDSLGAACRETGYAAADSASCDAAVEFYLQHQDELEACLTSYPADCSVPSTEACPPTKGPAYPF